MACSFQGTRTKGTALVVEMAWSMAWARGMSMAPCSMSTNSHSNPTWAMISAAKGCPRFSQHPTAGLPSRQSCLMRFGLILRLLPAMLAGPYRRLRGRAAAQHHVGVLGHLVQAIGVDDHQELASAAVDAGLEKGVPAGQPLHRQQYLAPS